LNEFFVFEIVKDGGIVRKISLTETGAAACDEKITGKTMFLTVNPPFRLNSRDFQNTIGTYNEVSGVKCTRVSAIILSSPWIMVFI
jgi:hypothetical protein